METNDMWNNKKFYSYGKVQIEFNGSSAAPDLEGIIASVRSVLKKHRWRGERRGVPSIKLRYGGGEWRNQMTTNPVWIELVTADDIIPAQMCAFYRFIEGFGPKLARSLAWRKIGARSISITMHQFTHVRSPKVRLYK